MHEGQESSAPLPSHAASDSSASKPAPDAPREEWLRWHLSGRPPRTRQHYETLARILDGG